ncbi:LuxR C-terminal-related transcriptional regulator [Escherichia coli]|nr:LuxR C-terminal-related transcriptional regulator [Escherichia coli]
MVVLFSHIFHSHSTKYIANKLNISNKTVYSHIYHAMEKTFFADIV